MMNQTNNRVEMMSTQQNNHGFTNEPMPVMEIKEQSRENCHVFLMDNGSYQAVFSSQGDRGETLMCGEVDDAFREEEGGKHYIQNKQHFKAQFNCEQNEKLFSISRGEYSIVVSAKRRKQSRARPLMPMLERCEKENAEEVLTYRDVLIGSDLVYSVRENGVKENIVVRKKKTSYKYAFLLNHKNLVLVQDEKARTIRFLDKNSQEVIFEIPAPFMSDVKGEQSQNVRYELAYVNDEETELVIVADSQWINDANRVFPVIIDPQINVAGDLSTVVSYSWQHTDLFDETRLYEYPLSRVGVVDMGGNTGYSTNRMYMNVHLPELPTSLRVKKAELQLTQQACSIANNEHPKIGLFAVTEAIYERDEYTPSYEENFIDFAYGRSKLNQGENKITYTFDITSFYDDSVAHGYYVVGLLVKMLDEMVARTEYVDFYGGAYTSRYGGPIIRITYDTGYEISERCNTCDYDLGPIGKASVNLARGNLMIDSPDFEWKGNRLPITIKHLFTSALANEQFNYNSSIALKTANFDTMNLGYGWRLNLMQSMVADSFVHNGTSYDGYVYMNETGAETYFKPCELESEQGEQHIYEDINGEGMLYDSITRELFAGTYKRIFDEGGHLVQVFDQYNNVQDIMYAGNKIGCAIDGANRVFTFAYNTNGQLTKITAPDKTSINYYYTDHFLTGIQYQDGSMVSISYDTDRGYPTSIIVADATGKILSKTEYDFSYGRVVSVQKYGLLETTPEAYEVGIRDEYTYSLASRQTVMKTVEPQDVGLEETTSTEIYTVYAFDDEDNVVSSYAYSGNGDKIGLSGNEGYIHTTSGGYSTKTQLRGDNLLRGAYMDNLTYWNLASNPESDFRVIVSEDEKVPYGNKAMCIASNNDLLTEGEVYQEFASALPEGDYILSAYIKVESTFVGADNPGAFIRIGDAKKRFYAQSEIVTTEQSHYERLVVPFKLYTDEVIRVSIIMRGKGRIKVNAIQLEENTAATQFNLVQSGGFESYNSLFWRGDGQVTSSEEKFSKQRALKIVGNLDQSRVAYQFVPVKQLRSTRETFVLSGWAKGLGVPVHAREDYPLPRFQLRAVIKYSDEQYADYETETYSANFSPCTEEWQYVSFEFAKKKYRTVENILIVCDYSYNSGIAYFDNLQLQRIDLENNLTAEDFAFEGAQDSLLASVVTGETSSTALEEDEMGGTPSFEEVFDTYGNALTQTNYANGGLGTFYRSFGYTPDTELTAGNDLIWELDSRENQTSYTVNPNDSLARLVSDRCGNQTRYSYDKKGRTVEVTLIPATGGILAKINYIYDPYSNLVGIKRHNDVSYTLNYDKYQNLESIVAGNDTIIGTYTYKKGTNRLVKITYANGDAVEFTYNPFGQLTTEHWIRSDSALSGQTYQYYYDSEGVLSRCLDTVSEVEYNYLYEDGRLVQVTQNNVSIDEHGYVVEKERIFITTYQYEKERLVKKETVFSGTHITVTTYYEESANGETISKTVIGDGTIISHSKCDNLGRKSFDELQLGTGFLSRQFTYLPGQVTDEHIRNGKLKSSPTTELVSSITLSNGRTLTYEYDEEERITKIIDSQDGTREYTYDPQGQLLTEVHNEVVVNTMTYDGYGNILTKNGIVYGYTAAWKDLLTRYNGSVITNDLQGNPLTYRGHTLTWEKGRQLRSFDNTTYSYNASGIRTSKTVGNVVHTYLLDGTNILREIWGANTLVPLYDNADCVCGIMYNNTAYYFLKNLQGDILSITDQNGEVVANYSYDAWGVCTIENDATSVGIATINPYRYRGYYYDTDTNLYYLQTRYYDPELGRFLNADEVKYLGYTGTPISYNLFAYSENNVVNKHDIYGTSWLGDLWSEAKNIVKTAKQTVVNAAERVGDAIGNTLSNFKTTVVETTNQIVEQVQNKIVVGKSIVMGGAQNVIFNALEQQKTAREKVSDFFVDLWTNATKKVLSQNLSRKTIIWNNGQIQFVELVGIDVLLKLIKIKIREKVNQLWESIQQTVKEVVIPRMTNNVLEFLGGFGIKIPFKLSIENLNKNRENLSKHFEADGYLDKQNNCVDAYLGYEKLSECGCEIIAVYNAMLKYGMKVELADAIFWAERLDVLMLSGFFGTNPYKISTIMDYMEVPYTRFDDIEEMNASIADGNIYILSSWNDINAIPGSLHTFMVYAYANEDGSVIMKAYNKSPADGHNGEYSSFSNIIELHGMGYICGYLIGKRG